LKASLSRAASLVAGHPITLHSMVTGKRTTGLEHSYLLLEERRFAAAWNRPIRLG
jgi:hypothetical protein